MKAIRQFLIAAALVANCTLVCAQTTDSISQQKPKMAQMPSFQGGDINTFARWVSQRLRYPKQLINSNIEGRLVMKFVLERDGSMTYWETVETSLKYGSSSFRTIPLTKWEKAQSPDSLFTKEVLRVIGQAPLWKPGILDNGEPARVFIQVPINFKLEGRQNPRTDRSLLPQIRQGQHVY